MRIYKSRRHDETREKNRRCVYLNLLIIGRQEKARVHVYSSRSSVKFIFTKTQKAYRGFLHGAAHNKGLSFT